MNENLGWTPNLDSFFYFIQKLLEVKLLEVLFWGVPAAHFNIHQNHKYIVQEEGVMLT